MLEINFVGDELAAVFASGQMTTQKRKRVSPLVGAGLGAAVGGPTGAIAGGMVAKGINKEQSRFEKQGPRSHLGKVGHDAKLGAKSVGVGNAVTAGLAGAALGASVPVVKKKGFLGLGRDKEAERKQRIKNTLIGAGLGVLGGGASGAVSGASTGALVGAGRGFVQENKVKQKKKGKFSRSNDLAEFSSNPQKKNRVGVKTGAALGLLGGGPLGAVGGGIVGNTIDRQIDKEQSRFKTSGPRSRMGKIKNDAKIGAKTLGGFGALTGALGGASIPGSAKQRAALALGGAVTKGIGGAIKGAVGGAGVGAIRGFRQPNKKKSLLDRIKN